MGISKNIVLSAMGKYGKIKIMMRTSDEEDIPWEKKRFQRIL